MIFFPSFSAPIFFLQSNIFHFFCQKKFLVEAKKIKLQKNNCTSVFEKQGLKKAVFHAKKASNKSFFHQNKKI